MTGRSVNPSAYNRLVARPPLTLLAAALVITWYAAGLAAQNPVALDEQFQVDTHTPASRVSSYVNVDDEVVGPPAGAQRQRVGGEDCTAPTVIPILPYVDSGDTSGFFDDYDEECPLSGNGRDVVYMYTAPADEAVDISLCASEFDTKLYVREDCPVGPYYACNEDACGGTTRSELRDLFLAGGNTYYIFVDGYYAAPVSGLYTLTMEVSSLLFDGFETGDTSAWSETVP